MRGGGRGAGRGHLKAPESVGKQRAVKKCEDGTCSRGGVDMSALRAEMTRDILSRVVHGDIMSAATESAIAMKDIIDYYAQGGPSNATQAESALMKQQSKEWQDLLKKEFYDNANPLGRQGLYLVLKNKKKGKIGDYPTKRFVGSWLRRQVGNQVNRRAPKSAPSIQAVITSKPNELIQIDFLYFFRHITGEPIIEDDDDADLDALRKQQDKLKKKKIVYQGCITAIDCFSRVGYAVPIRGNINSKKAFKALQTILALSKKRYGTHVKKIQTDKGSEFMGTFRKGVKQLETDHPTYYQHHFGYTGRSQTQGLVERFNGTLKRLLHHHLNFKLGSEWKNHLVKAVSNYNSNPHRIIKMSPDDVKPSNYKEVKRSILDRAKKSDRFQGIVYKPGDFVRLKIYGVGM